MQILTALVPVRYAGKDYLPGDTMEVSDKDALLLKAIKKAAEGDGSKTVDLPSTAKSPALDIPKADPVDTGGDEMKELRERYKALVGRNPFNGWDADTLRSKINTYRTRDMRAGE